MKLSNREHAYVPRSKLENYLLSESHVVGRTKAKFLRMVGFDKTNSDLLVQGLINIAQNEKVTKIISSPYGKKYLIDGSLKTPANRFVKVRTVWIIDKGHDKPRFITAYPK